MHTFEKIEEEHARIPVSCSCNVAAAGVLLLDGPKTRVILSSELPLEFSTDENGWFDLWLKAANGQTILLHHALKTQTISYGFAGAHETHIFANAIVFSRSAKSDGIRSISFKMRGLPNFFRYEYAEWQPTRTVSADAIRAINLLRSANLRAIGRERTYDFFRPEEIYVVHRVPRILKFRVKDRHYEIGVFSQQNSWGGDRIDLRMEPIANIIFDAPTGLDEALRWVWEWQHFFVQIAMESMPIEAISIRSDRSFRSEEAPVYLPNLERHSPGDIFRSHRGEVPFNNWKERKQLALAMQAWLMKRDERQTFRGLLNRVIENMDKSTDINDVVKLCAAIESVPDLSETSHITPSDLKLMAEVAASALFNRGTQIEPEQIRNLLAPLRRTSLSRRLRILGERIAFAISSDEFEIVAKQAYRLRNMVAHGQSRANLDVPIVAPVVEALASMCALFDLSSSGIPKEVNQHGNMSAANRARHAAAELRPMTSRRCLLGGEN